MRRGGVVIKHTYNHYDGCLKIAVTSVMLPMMKPMRRIMVMLLMAALEAIMATMTADDEYEKWWRRC